MQDVDESSGTERTCSMTDFDTIRAALQLHILGAASLNDWKMASGALSRVEAAAEQAVEALALADEIISPISAASEEVGIKILAFRAALASPNPEDCGCGGKCPVPHCCMRDTQDSVDPKEDA